MIAACETGGDCGLCNICNFRAVLGTTVFEQDGKQWLCGPLEEKESVVHGDWLCEREAAVK